MLENMIAYQQKIEQLIKNDSSDTDWGRESSYFQTKLEYLQHERLIHLLVTLTVGLACLISCFAYMAYLKAPLAILCLILLPLFLAYIIHYRKLENSTQNCYHTLDKLHNKL